MVACRSGDQAVTMTTYRDPQVIKVTRDVEAPLEFLVSAAHVGLLDLSYR